MNKIGKECERIEFYFWKILRIFFFAKVDSKSKQRLKILAPSADNYFMTQQKRKMFHPCAATFTVGERRICAKGYCSF